MSGYHLHRHHLQPEQRVITLSPPLPGWSTGIRVLEQRYFGSSCFGIVEWGSGQWSAFGFKQNLNTFILLQILTYSEHNILNLFFYSLNNMTQTLSFNFVYLLTDLFLKLTNVKIKPLSIFDYYLITCEIGHCTLLN